MTNPEPQQPDAQPRAKSGSSRGAQQRNANATRHGLRGSKLPAGCSYILKSANRFRASLETAVVDVHGEITLTDAAIINTAMRWERHAQLAQRWLAQEAGTMSAADRLAYSRDSARASESRDRAIAQLDLRQRKDDSPGSLYALDAQPTYTPPISTDVPEEQQ